MNSEFELALTALSITAWVMAAIVVGTQPNGHVTGRALMLIVASALVGLAIARLFLAMVR